MQIKSFVLAAAMLAVPAISHASPGITADMGTTGAGAHLAVPIANGVNARFGVNAMTYNYTTSTTDVKYDFKATLQTVDALLDFYPITGSNFRVTGGAVLNGNKVSATGKATDTGTYTINGHTYTAADAGRIDGKVDFRSVAPYLGIGWGNAASARKGWSFSSDLGVLFQGSPRTSLANSGCTAPSSVCSQLASDVAAENADLKSKADNFKLYPVLRLGVGYRF